ncbi:MAG: hypothetical protein IKR92_05430 [Alphaproteobacteria bacterium]|nr:hypothetical protein [Alphaproteobacteria bacterium]
MRRFLYFLIMLCAAFPAYAQLKEYAHLYDVDMQEELPMLWRLEKEREQAMTRYNWKYDFNWHIGTVFDSEFRRDIKTFGAVEKRINNPDEESLLRDLKHIPPVFYPYIGPALHTVRGLSGKILDLPGIKGTKHKFPERIASVFQDIPDIEFVSPELYIYLSPQFWGEDMQSLEMPQLAQNQTDEEMPNMRINPEFMQKIKAKVKASDYGAGKKGPTQSRGIRHFDADANTPLSSADVEAFIGTLDALDAFRKNKDNELRLWTIDPLISYWEQKNGVPKEVSFLKQVVNPCQTIVRKVRWTGLQTEFQKAIGAQGFGAEDWAYTCEKTIKAYRVHNMPQSYISTLKLQRKGNYYRYLDAIAVDEEEKKQYRYFLEAFVHMYDTDLENIKAIKPHNKELRRRLYDLDMNFAGTPIILP